MITNSYDKENKFITKELKESSLLYEPIGNLSFKIIPAIKESEVFGKGEDWQADTLESIL